MITSQLLNDIDEILLRIRRASDSLRDGEETGPAQEAANMLTEGSIHIRKAKLHAAENRAQRPLEGFENDGGPDEFDLCEKAGGGL